MSERIPPLPRADRLLNALKQSPAPNVASERLLANVQLQVARAELPDFAHEVLPSSSLKVVWLGKLAKTLLLSSLAAGLATWAAVREKPVESPRVIVLQTAQVSDLAPTISPLAKPAETPQPKAAPIVAPMQTVRSGNEQSGLPPMRATKMRKTKPPLAPPVAPSESTPSVFPLGQTLSQADSEPSAQQEVAHDLEKLAPHDPRDLEEMRRVADAEQLLTRDPERALHMVREDNQRFQNGYFHEERRYFEIMALVALGQRDDARALARLFLKDYARGPYRARVKQALALD